jgi:hypothetical protein
MKFEGAKVGRKCEKYPECRGMCIMKKRPVKLTPAC